MAATHRANPAVDSLPTENDAQTPQPGITLDHLMKKLQPAPAQRQDSAASDDSDTKSTVSDNSPPASDEMPLMRAPCERSDSKERDTPPAHDIDLTTFVENIDELAEDGASPTECLATPQPTTPAPQAESRFSAAVIQPAQLTAYQAFQLRSGCSLVFDETTKRHVMVLNLPGAVPKPAAFNMAAIHRKRQNARAARPVKF